MSPVVFILYLMVNGEPVFKGETRSYAECQALEVVTRRDHPDGKFVCRMEWIKR